MLIWSHKNTILKIADFGTVCLLIRLDFYAPLVLVEGPYNQIDIVRFSDYF